MGVGAEEPQEEPFPDIEIRLEEPTNPPLSPTAARKMAFEKELSQQGLHGSKIMKTVDSLA